MALPVTKDPNDVRVPEEGMPTSTGVPAGMPGEGQGDGENFASQIEQIKSELKKRDEDLNRLRSTYDRNAAQKEKQFQEEKKRLVEARDAIAMKNMDEKARLEYQYKRMAEDYQQAIEDRQRLQQELESRNQMGEYANVFKEMGVDPSTLDQSDLDSLISSGWQGVRARLQTLQEENERIKANPSSQPPQLQQNRQKVVTTNSSVPNDRRITFGQLQKQLSDSRGHPVSPQEAFRYLDQHPEKVQEIIF